MLVQQLVHEELDLGLVFGFCAGVFEVGFDVESVGLFLEGDAEIDVVDEPTANSFGIGWAAWRSGTCRSA